MENVVNQTETFQYIFEIKICQHKSAAVFSLLFHII